MLLKSIYFVGRLFDSSSEEWKVEGFNRAGRLDLSVPAETNCLKHRIQRFVIKGGECLLRIDGRGTRTEVGPDGDDSWRALPLKWRTLSHRRNRAASDY